MKGNAKEALASHYLCLDMGSFPTVDCGDVKFNLTVSEIMINPQMVNAICCREMSSMFERSRDLSDVSVVGQLVLRQEGFSSLCVPVVEQLLFAPSVCGASHHQSIPGWTAAIGLTAFLVN